jgi:hypothetical protein
MVLAAVTIAAADIAAQSRPGLTADTQRRLMESLNKGEAYLKSQQAPDGTWEKNPGITGLAVTVILKQPGKSKAAQLPAVTKSLDYLVSLAKPDGGIYIGPIPHYHRRLSDRAGCRWPPAGPPGDDEGRPLPRREHARRG